MKTSSILLSLTLAAVSVSAAPRGFGQQGQQGQQRGAGNNGKGAAAAASTVAVESNAATAAAAASSSAAAANNAGSGAAAGAAAASNSTAATASTGSTASTGTITATGSLSTDSLTTNATANNPDPQSSTTLDPRVIATGFLNNGQDVQEAGQVASITSNNNFINYCLTQGNLPITNGLQITSGSCNPAPIGTIPAVSLMPSSKFSNPANGDTITANQEFTISMNIQNLDTGNFVNANENYFAAPQQLNAQGQIIGHTHVVIEAINGLADTTPTNPQTFAFFKGVNTAAVNGAVTADVTNGVPAGTYRLCSINSSSNHQPVIVPVAQHGGLDDCVYFTASAGGSATATASNSTAATGAAASGAGAAAAASNSTAAAAGTGAAATGAGAAGAAGAAAGNAAAGAAAAKNGAAAAQSGNAATAQAATAQPAKAGAAKAGSNANQAKGGKGKRMMYSRATL
jgi:hypothetical protein